MSATTFAQRYQSIFERTATRLCIGLDTDERTLPASVRGAANPILEFNSRIIDATSDLCCAYKPNLAFYESSGRAGLEALEGTLARIPEGVIRIGDAKRGDIGNTAERYAVATLETLAFDAVTVNPYMGTDTLEPYFAFDGVCVFVLALTSNPGSNEFQRQLVDGLPLYRRVIDACVDRFGDTGKLGFVVGATHPDELAAVRQHVGPSIPLLIPGLGAQGGDAERNVRANDGGIAFFNVSRGIAGAGSGEDFAEQARRAAKGFVEALSEKQTV
ncbi:MAG TPA: orotidine-5'-phosphate decarboxylase [Candidatus Kapabacteria bacterium]|nr:orotidine-5'-phosphate decarboxylase [Candidatus Kapabacteria bacterium]